jgi:hypothetical protein
LNDPKSHGCPLKPEEPISNEFITGLRYHKRRFIKETLSEPVAGGDGEEIAAPQLSVDHATP